MLDFKSKITEKILGYYFLNTSASHYINELARIIKADPGNLDRKLKTLEKEGLLESRTQGNQKYYFLNKKYPLLNELKKIYNLKCGLETKLAEKLKNLKNLKAAYIFGSYAKNKFKTGSDIDLLLVGNHSSLEAKRLLLKLAEQLRCEINIIDLTEKELTKRKKIITNL